MHVGTLFILAMILVLVLATQMKIRHMTKKLDYLLGKSLCPMRTDDRMAFLRQDKAEFCSVDHVNLFLGNEHRLDPMNR